jgi:uncharacterized protein (TIGR02996 family)
VRENRILYKDVLRWPEEDRPRASYADWLRGRRDPRGDFINAQLRLHTLRSKPGAWAEYDEAEAEAEALLAGHGDEWLGDAGKFAVEARLDRGFVDLVTMDAADFPRLAKGLFRVAPVLHLRLRNAAGQLEAIARQPQLRQVVSLSLFKSGATDADVEALCRSPYAVRIAWLDLGFCDVGMPGLEALFRHGLPRLDYLNAVGNRCEDPADRSIMRDGVCTYTVSDFGAALEGRFGPRHWLRRRKPESLFDLPIPQYYVGR